MSDELVPILVAPRLSLERVVAVARAAMAHEEVDLALEAEPIEEGLHAVELHTPELGGPLVLLGTPVGRAPGGLHRVRVRPLHSAQAAELDRFITSILPAPDPTAPAPSAMPEADLDRWLHGYIAPSAAEDDPEPAAASSSRGEQLRNFLSSSALPMLSLVSLSELPTVPGAEDRAILDTLDDLRPGRTEPPPPPESVGPDPMIGRMLAGRYLIDKRIGKGGMGRVYAAQDVEIDRPVAVKVLNAEQAADPTAVRRFRREAIAHQRIEHPNVLRVHEQGMDGDLPYLVMDFIPGRDLRAILDEQRILPLPRIVAIMAQVCSALWAAHTLNVVHRDIKPANIMVHETTDEGGQPYEHVTVCDFGLAKAYGEKPKTLWGDSSPVTGIGASVGTPEYLSPEQALGEDCDPRTDIYTCGAVMYEMATGSVPFAANQLMALLVAVATKAPRPPSELCPSIDRRLEALILKALSKNRSLRHPTAPRLRADLLALVPDAGRRQTRRWSPR